MQKKRQSFFMHTLPMHIHVDRHDRLKERQKERETHMTVT